MKIAGAIMRGVWVEQRHIADPAVLQKMLEESGLPARRLDDSQSQAVHEPLRGGLAAGDRAGVFGAPSYIYDGELFWGQDRLDFLERRLAHRSETPSPACGRGPGEGRPPSPPLLPVVPRLAEATHELFASPDIESHFSAATL
jgi:hypothetical protein